MKLARSLFQRFIPKRIWQQIFLILVFVIIIPLVILGLLLVQTSQKAIKTTVFRDHKEIAVRTTGEVKEHIEGARRLLMVTAALLGTLNADAWRQETTIVELSLRDSSFQRISSVNADGQEIATSEVGTDMRDRSGEESFQKALSGESYLSNVKISKNHIPYLTLAEPVRLSGKIKNVLIADLNVRSIWDLVDGIQVGKTGKAYLIDQQGRIIAHPDKRLVLQNEHISNTKIFADILVGKAGNTEEVENDGRRFLVSYAPVHHLNWGLVIVQPESEAYAFSRLMKIQSWIIILTSILGAIFLSLILARFICHPINEIMTGTQQVARGDFSHRFRIKRRNDLGKLLFSFNQMTLKLRKARDMERLSIIGKAATAVAHELKNSLLLVETFVALLPQRQKDKKFIQEFSETIPKELDSWNTSLKNMMTFSQNGFPFLRDNVNVNDIIKDVALLTKFKARQLNIHFMEHLSENVPVFSGNTEKLKQVILNLMTNALEGTPSGGTITISTQCEENKGFEDLKYVVVTVTNTIEHYQRADLKKFFEPFYSTKIGGLGLGLSISKDIVEQHAGRIEAVIGDNEDRISFIIKIPVETVSLKEGMNNFI